MPITCRHKQSKAAWFVHCAAVCLCLLGVATVATAQSLDMDAGSTKPATAPKHETPKPSVGGLDMDAVPDAPISAQASPRAPTGDNVQAGITTLGPKAIPDPATPATLLTSPEQTHPPGQPAEPAPPPDPVKLDHPKVIDTAKLQSGDTTVSLFGVEGLAGDAAQNLQGYLSQTDDHLTCQEHEGEAFVCLMSDGTDLALVALRNGAARTKAEAPDVYREQENLAQADRRGIWANLPPPPETVKHPVVKDTATLIADNKTYVLDGVVGLPAPYSAQLQSYIASNGDSVTCMPQGAHDHFVCLLADGTDLAKVVLVNGAARASPGVPPSYRAQQLEALTNRRGYWATASQDVVAMAEKEPPASAAYALKTGDDGVDGVNYAGGAPVAVIEGEPEPVFLIYGNNLGWGYYDHDRHWRRAPDRYQHHLEAFHHAGEGLRGYDRGHFVASGHDAVLRPGVEAHPVAAVVRAEARPVARGPTYRPEERGPTYRPEERGPIERQAVAREAEPMGHLAGRESPSPMGRTAGEDPMGHIAGRAAPGAAGAPGAGRAAGGGGMFAGFLHPAAGASAGGFHPGGMGGVGVARAAPAAHVSMGGGGGRHK